MYMVVLCVALSDSYFRYPRVGRPFPLVNAWSIKFCCARKRASMKLEKSYAQGEALPTVNVGCMNR